MRELANSPITTIHFSAVTFPYVGDTKVFGQVAISVPTLRTLIVDGYSRELPSITSPSLERLRILSGNVSFGILCAIIKASKHLQEVDLTNTLIRPPKPVDIVDLDLPTMRSLTHLVSRQISMDTGFSIDLARFSPNLENLSLSITGYSRSAQKSPPLSFQKLAALTLDISLINEWKATAPDAEMLRPIVKCLVSAEELEELVLLQSESSGVDPTLVVQSLLIGSSPNFIPCPRLKRLKAEGTIYWPSIYSRIMIERAASPEDILKAGYDPDPFDDDLRRPRFFNVDLKFMLRKKDTPDGLYPFVWMCKCQSWKRFRISYREMCEKMMAEGGSSNDETFGMEKVPDEGNAEDRLEFLCEELSKALK
jgi:hypothetical protein